ncbi:MAG: FkbM family methyltransferase [Bacteroidota bacterium]
MTSLTRRLRRSRWARTLVAPLLTARRYAQQRGHRRKLEIWTRFTALLAEDPVVQVDEFEGFFQLDARSHVFRRIVLHGEYEPEISRLCRTYAPADRDAIDVGANAGFYSVLLARLSNSRRVVAVEPSRPMLARLRANLDRNGVADRVIVVEGGLSDSKGTAELSGINGLEEYGTIGTLAHPSLRHLSDSAPSEITTIQTFTLDDLVAAYDLDPGFIKVDVEGVEALVFRGATHVLATHRPVILSELDDALLRANGSSALDVTRLFHDAGYRVLDPHDPALLPVDPSSVAQLDEILCIPNESVQ